LFSAKGAGFTTSLEQRPQGYQTKFVNAESAIHFEHVFGHYFTDAAIAQQSHPSHHL
jgi:hypothetical protein